MIKTTTLHDDYGVYPVNHMLFKREKIYETGKPVSVLEITYERILKLHNLIDKLRNRAIRRNNNEAQIYLTYQRSALSETLRIVYQQILIERGIDPQAIQEKENERKWTDLKQR
jgi:predicted HAD superfamily Cof-like phosphohydrolase